MVAKNPNRVAAQLRGQLRIQRERMLGQAIACGLLLAVALLPIFVRFIPLVVQVTCIALIPFALFGIYTDFRLLRKKREKLLELDHAESQQ